MVSDSSFRSPSVIVCDGNYLGMEREEFVTKTDTLRGRFEQAKRRFVGNADDLDDAVAGFEAGYQAAQPTEAEIEELAREIAADVDKYNYGHNKLDVDDYAELLRGKLGGTGRGR